ncbi:hypothetical protein HMPREF1366_00070 [Enterococcus faecium ERV26]|nr:hypothetical protein HMPREF1381_00499 [Enterococcus faecium R501]EJX97041.1 hypothetical protein HMPREF1366_00070 [Enterococcus faecium ERV26]
MVFFFGKKYKTCNNVNVLFVCFEYFFDLCIKINQFFANVKFFSF